MMHPQTSPPRTGRKVRRAAALTLLAGLWLLFCTLPAAAHPPQELSLSYDFTAQTLTVRISHGVSSPGLHHIGKVAIRKNGLPLATVNYDQQPATETFAYSYPVEAAVGAVLEVTATCNVFGAKSAQLTVIRKPLRVSSLHR